MMPSYDPTNWFWVVGGDARRAWSSRLGSYVSDYPSDRVTRIASEADLGGVLRQLGMSSPAPEMVDYQNAIQSHVDSTAVSRSYDSGISLAGYVNSTIPAWAAEAQTFIAWRDAVWVYAYQEMDMVQTGKRVQPSVAELMAELPQIRWPA